MTKREQYLDHERKRLRKERKYAKKLSKAITEASAPAIAEAATDGTVNENLFDSEILSNAIIELYQDTGFEFFKRSFLLVEKMKQKQSPDILESLFTDRVAEFIHTYGAFKITSISETLRKQLQIIVSDAFKQGLSIPKTAKLIEQQFGNISRVRALAIARTETTAAASYGSIEGARATGLTVQKIWIAAFDERTRRTHAQADSDHIQGIGLDDLFQVGSDQMQGPGRGSQAKENVNCRCAVGYIVL